MRRDAAQAILAPDRLSREEKLALKNIEHSLAVLNARRPVIRVQHLLGMDGALHICADIIGGSFSAARAVQGPVHLDAGLVLLRRDPPVLCSEIELVGAAIAVDMVNRERFIAVNSELPGERRDELVVAILHERWIMFQIWGDDCNIESNDSDGILVELTKDLQHFVLQ